MTEQEYNDTRPYCDDEVADAIHRIAENIYFPLLADYVCPEKSINEFAEEFKKIASVDEFQDKFTNRAVGKIIEQTIKNFTYGGVENISNLRPAMQISNHRDIVLDSALLQFILHRNGLNTAEITFGSNLMNPQFVVDLGKINKMFKIVRGGTMRELFQNSKIVSEYMRFAITRKGQSTWIAQRNGRTKDGDDKTEIAALKMFAMGSDKGFSENLAELNITPVSVSYEYEPCDFLKMRETYISRRQSYVKQPGEDLLSILHGIKQYKGNVHFQIAGPITEVELADCEKLPHNERFRCLANIIDNRIYQGYKLWKTNYMAHDMMKGVNEFGDKYTLVDKAEFTLYMEKGLDKIEGDHAELMEIFLKIYANPIAVAQKSKINN
jgi:hypothetical protein